MLDADLDKAVLDLIEQWNIAETRIKRAEQVRANEIVAPAIFELRYAGRKIVDSLEIVLKSDISSDTKSRDTVVSYIADATEDCVKAKHDAIDAMMNFVTSWFDDLEKKIGVEEIQKFFPNYFEVVGTISVIQEQIADSRGDRNKLRDSIYNRIDGEDYDKVLNLFVTMKSSQERVTLASNRNKSKSRKENNLKYYGLVFGAAGWVGLLIQQYRASSFPFAPEIWTSLRSYFSTFLGS